MRGRYVVLASFGCFILIRLLTCQLNACIQAVAAHKVLKRGQFCLSGPGGSFQMKTVELSTLLEQLENVSHDLPYALYFF